MSIYLPIAELSVNLFVLLSLGGVVGFLSGMFGLGGGFLMTPLLIFIGIPTNVAVATSANQIVASSISGTIGHWRQGLVDFKMGGVLLIGSVFGSYCIAVARNPSLETTLFKYCIFYCSCRIFLWCVVVDFKVILWEV
mgnify:CR=1 FL=1